MKNITGQKFGILTAIRFVQRKNNKYYWLFKCNCGIEKIIRNDLPKNGQTKSCGCLNIKQLKSAKNILKLSKISLTHGMSGTRFYKAWGSMKGRCLQSNKTHRGGYYDRNIAVSSEWLISFENFKNDMYESYLKHVKEFGEKNTTLDRRDNNKGYSKENCRWATYKEQSNNRTNTPFITFENQIYSIVEWSNKLNIKRYNIIGRLKKGWDLEKTFLTPVKKYNKS